MGISTPSVGDFCLCMNCGELCRFGIGFSMIKVDEVEFILHTSPENRDMTFFFQKKIRQRGLSHPEFKPKSSA